MALDEQQKKQLLIAVGGGVAIIAIIVIVRRPKSATPPDVSSPLFSLSGTSGPGGGVVGTPTPTPTPGPTPQPNYRGPGDCPEGFHRDDAGHCVPDVGRTPNPQPAQLGSLGDLLTGVLGTGGKGGPGDPVPSMTESSPYDIERTYLWSATGMYLGQDV